MRDGMNISRRRRNSALNFERPMIKIVPQINIDESSENHTEINGYNEIRGHLSQLAQDVTYSRFTSILDRTISFSAIVPWFDTTNLIDVPVHVQPLQSRSAPKGLMPRLLENNSLFEVPIQLHTIDITQSPIGTFDDPTKSSLLARKPQVEDTNYIIHAPVGTKRPRTSRSKRVNIDPITLPFMWRRLKVQEANRIRQRRFRKLLTKEQRNAYRIREKLRKRRLRKLQTAEQRAATRARATARQREAREQNRSRQTPEQRAATKARDAARRKEARLRQSEEQRAAAKARATSRKRDSRERNQLRQTAEQRAAALAIDAACRKVARKQNLAQQPTHSSNPVEAVTDGSAGIVENQASRQLIGGVNGMPPIHTPICDPKPI